MTPALHLGLMKWLVSLSVTALYKLDFTDQHVNTSFTNNESVEDFNLYNVTLTAH